MDEVAGLREKLTKVNRQVKLLVKESAVWLSSLNSAHSRIDRLKFKLGDLSARVDGGPGVTEAQEERISRLEDAVSRWRGEVLELRQQLVQSAEVDAKNAEVGAQNALNLRQHVAGLPPDEWSTVQVIQESKSPFECFREITFKQVGYANLECGHDIMSARVQDWKPGDKVRCPICEDEARKKRQTVPLEEEEEREGGPGVEWCLHCDFEPRTVPEDGKCPRCGHRMGI